MEPDKQDFVELLGLVDEPLAFLDQSRTRPGKAALDKRSWRASARWSFPHVDLMTLGERHSRVAARGAAPSAAQAPHA